MATFFGLNNIWVLDLAHLPAAITLGAIALLLLACGYLGAPLGIWTLVGAIALALTAAPVSLWIGFGAIALLFNLPLLRRSLLSRPLLHLIQARQLLPQISATERAAIDAGTVWVEGEFFSGRPNFQRILQQPYPPNSPELQAFLDGPVDRVCEMATDWEIHQRKDLPPAVWDYLRQERFFGMMIPAEYGGLGFSNLAYSAVMQKLASRSFIHTATVGVTNSLGPAKLLLRYGTPEQKAHYLPRLARGEEMPCFALTEPLAGSDAGSITADGLVFRDSDGDLYLRLNWSKRYITLGAIATLIGLAFRLRDPENLLGKGTSPGITVALLAATTPGVQLGRRHDPMGVPFYNSPILGQDVVIPVSQIIGGVEQAGQGWPMLMQSLAAGRGISFPATCTGIAKLVSRTAGNYAGIRQQFGRSIGRFEGIEAPLARIGGLTYLLEAARRYTVSAVDEGQQPAVVSAIAKYNFTEISRQIVNDGMDILGGAGICRGPRNLLANVYTAMPIPITVEGANILTRSMIVFGQGVIRCHPYLYGEVKALEAGDVVAFDRLIWSHGGWLVRNIVRAQLLTLVRGGWGWGLDGPISHYQRRLSWASAVFAVLGDLALIGFGAGLKRRENLTGRFADALSWMYLASATLRRFEAEGHRTEDLPLFHWAMQYALAQVQESLVGLMHNFDLPILGRVLRLWGPIGLMPLGAMPSDRLSAEVAQLLQSQNESRDRLTADIYLPQDTSQALGRLEHALDLVLQTAEIHRKLKAAQAPSSRHGVETGVITPAQAALYETAQAARLDAVQVDSFTLEEYFQSGVDTPQEMLARISGKGRTVPG